MACPCYFGAAVLESLVDSWHSKESVDPMSAGFGREHHTKITPWTKTNDSNHTRHERQEVVLHIMSGYPGGIPAGVHTAQPVQFPPHHPSNIHVPGGPPPGPPTGAAPPGGAPVPDSYFTESKKGEVNELRTLLRNFAVERDRQRKRDIIKKVIAYMTLVRSFSHHCLQREGDFLFVHSHPSGLHQFRNFFF